MAVLFEPLRRFFSQARLSFMALYGWLRPQIYILTNIVTPVLSVVFFATLARFAYGIKDVTPYVIGNAVVLCTYSAFFGAGGVLRNERNFGTLELVMGAPYGGFALFASRSIPYILDALLSVSLGLLVGNLCFGVSWAQVNFGALIVALLVSIFAAESLGLLVSTFGLIVQDMNLISNTLASSLLVFTGANFAITLLPPWMQKISWSLPTTRGIAAARLAVGGAPWSAVGRLLLGEFALGWLYMLIGYGLLRLMQRRARVSGTMNLQ